jgi:molybdopterin-guanine dinucleotide biosynthesis protein B
MPTPYIARFISARSGVGKTTIASLLVKELRARGYRVGVIKHAVSSLSLEEKDSKKYLDSGAETVVVSSSDLAVIYVRGHRDLLEDAVTYVKTPIVIVEGFRESNLGDVVVVTSSRAELEDLLNKGIKPLAVVYMGESQLELSSKDVRVIRSTDLGELVRLLESSVLEHYYQQTPRLNCGKCNYNTCRELVKAYARGSTPWCPVASRGVRLQVDDVEIALNPFVKNTIKSTIQGLIAGLKGIPVNWSKVTLTISRED